MLDGFIYRLLDRTISLCEKIREKMIMRSLPNPCKTAREWRKDYDKWKKTNKTGINSNDSD